MNEAVAITGWGAVSALGVGRDVLWPALRDGRSGVRRIERFSTEDDVTQCKVGVRTVR